MAYDRGQYIVEVVRHAPGKLADRLHLGRLRHLPLELALLAIVLEREQHRRLAQPAHARQAERDRLVGLVAHAHGDVARHLRRSEEHTSELQSLMRISYAVFCLKKKTQHIRLKKTMN